MNKILTKFSITIQSSLNRVSLGIRADCNSRELHIDESSVDTLTLTSDHRDDDEYDITLKSYIVLYRNTIYLKATDSRRRTSKIKQPQLVLFFSESGSKPSYTGS